MRVLKLLQNRFERGYSLESIGPNEARLVFDASAAILSALFAAGFCYWFDGNSRHFLNASALPFLFLLVNWVLGIYSRQRMALARVKVALLFSSIALCSIAEALWSQDLKCVVLWACFVGPPTMITRLVFSLYTDRHRDLSRRIVSNDDGPVLVIGGAGYIGSHTVELLLKAGREVRVLDCLMYGDSSLEPFRDNTKFSLIEGDATDIAKLTLAVQGCSAVVHLAGLVGDPACAVNPEFTRHTNIIATRMARQVAQSMGVRRFVFASSCSVYGLSDKEVTETGPLNPVSLYAETKIDSERELLLNVPDDFFVTVLRFATVFGHSARPRFDLVGNLFAAQAINDGRITVIGPEQWRPFIHVRDLARAIVLVLSAKEETIQSQVLNVGDKRLNLTILQLAEKVKAVASSYRPVEISVTDNPQDRRNYAVSFDKITRVLGFQAETMIEDGIQEILEHFARGTYKHYRSEAYSNVAMTTRALASFFDPDKTSHLYAPIGERVSSTTH
jgi:nucleoside-diphosphate-sugar epimerase